MPLNLRKEDIELLWLIQPNLQADNELEIKKKFDKPTLSMEVNDLMYLTISSDFDYIYKLNPTSSSYRANSTFFVFKVNASSQTVQDFLVLKFNPDIESSTLDSFMSYLMDYTDLLDLESASLKNETLRKIFFRFQRKETCAFNQNETANKQDVLNSLNFHHQNYVDKEKAEMIKNGGEVIGNGIVSLATMASNLIDTIGTQIASSCEQQPQQAQQSQRDERMNTGSSCSSGGSSDESGDEENNVQAKVAPQTKGDLSRKDSKEASSSRKDREGEHSKRHHRHSHRHSRKHRRRESDQNEEEEGSSSRRHHRRSRRAANLKAINQFTRSFSQTATIAATAISTAITETASYVVPAMEEYLPSVISKVTNYDEETSRQMVGSTLGYGKVALDAIGSVKNSMSEGAGIIGSSVASQTTNVVKNKYGDSAAQETEDALGAVGNVAKTYTTVKNAKKII